MINPEREVMGSLLATNAELVADVLRRADGEPGSDAVMRAIAATRSLSVIVEDTLRSLVFQARSEGRTWAEIGEVLHVTRQAAFQRFGGTSLPHDDPEERAMAPIENAGELAMPVIRNFLESDWGATRANFDKRMLEACTVELLASVRDQVRDTGGEPLEIGVPQISLKQGYSVVEVPIAFEQGEAISTVSLNADGQVAGFFIRRADA